MLPESERLPVDTTNFWRGRIFHAVATGMELHKIIYNVEYEKWRSIQNETAGLIRRHIKPGQKLLDAGCGYGALYDCFRRRDDYWGIDLSPDLIELGKIRHPDIRLEVGDLRTLPHYESGFFDLVVCRSVEVMIKDNLSDQMWVDIQQELKRVGKRVMVMEYGDPVPYKFVE